MMAAHVEDRLEAYVAGEMTPVEAERVRAHCQDCPRCRRALAEVQSVWRALGEDPSPELPRPLWPLLGQRLGKPRSPRARLVLALSASAAGVAGLLLGVLLGSQLIGAPGAWQQETWSEVGSLLADGEQSTLDQVYVSGFEEGGEGE